MQAKLEAEVQYAKARVDTEAMVEMVRWQSWLIFLSCADAMQMEAICYSGY